MYSDEVRSILGLGGASRGTARQEDRQCVKLEVKAWVFHGLRGRQMRFEFPLGGLLPSSTIRELKEHLLRSFFPRPDEIELINKEGVNPEDDRVLSEWWPRPDEAVCLQIGALVCYGVDLSGEQEPLSNEEEEEDSDDALPPELSQAALSLHAAGDDKQGPASTASTAASTSEALELRPPPCGRVPAVLIDSSQREPRFPRESTRGSLFQITVDVTIFLGLHGHRRSCELTRLALLSTLSDLADEVLAWLGLPPDELSVVGFEDVDTSTSLTDAGLTAGSAVGIVAWYKDATNHDLSAARLEASRRASSRPAESSPPASPRL